MRFKKIGSMGFCPKYDKCEHDFVWTQIQHSEKGEIKEFWKCRKCGIGVNTQDNETYQVNYYKLYIDPDAKETEAKLGSCERYCWDWDCPHCAKENKSAPDKIRCYCNYCSKPVYLKPIGQAMFDRSDEPWSKE